MGTAVTIHMNVYGNQSVLNLLISKPEPGRVLVETDEEAGMITTFTVDALKHGQSQVTITPKAQASPGLKGSTKKLMDPLTMRRIFREELA